LRALVWRGRPVGNPDAYFPGKKGQLRIWIPKEMEFKDNVVHIVMDECGKWRLAVAVSAILP